MKLSEQFAIFEKYGFGPYDTWAEHDIFGLQTSEPVSFEDCRILFKLGWSTGDYDDLTGPETNEEFLEWEESEPNRTLWSKYT